MRFDSEEKQIRFIFEWGYLRKAVDADDVSYIDNEGIPLKY